MKRLAILVALVLAGAVTSWFGTAQAAAPRSANGLVINEVYAPNTTYSSQYFELYNNSAVAIDLSSYVIYNSGGSDNLNVLPNPSIGPGRWLAIGATQFATATIGSGLNPTADFLALVQHSGGQDNVVDVVNWGTPSPSWPNYYRFQSYFWVSNAPTMPTDTNQSLQRFPNGRDTDQPADWTALARTPGSPPPPTATPSPSASPTGGVATATPTAYCGDAYEPDNNPNQAKALILNTEQTNHTICPSGDEDWYTISVVSDKVYTLYTKDLGGGLDTIMAVYTFPYEGVKIAENDDQANCLCSRIDMSFPSSGTYLVRVRDNRLSGGLNWTYTVGFTANPGPAPTSTPSFTPTPNPNAPTATPTSAPCLDAYEPDGTADAANLLLIGDVQRAHTFCPDGDADWYRFFGGRGKAYTIATANLGIGVDTYMYLFDSDGKTVIAENDDITGPPPSGGPNDVVASAIQFFPVRDTYYYIMVKNKGDLGAPFMTYDISMKIQANVPPPAGSPTPIIAPVVTVPAPTQPPLPTIAPPTQIPDTPMPLPTAPPTPGPATAPTDTATPPPSGSVSGATGGQGPTAPPAPPPAAEPTSTPLIGPPQGEPLPTAAPVVPLPATGHALDPAQSLTMPLVVYVDLNANKHYSPAEGVRGLGLLFLGADGTALASARTDPQGVVRVMLPRGSRAIVAIPYLHWSSSVQATSDGLLVRLPQPRLPTRIP